MANKMLIDATHPEETRVVVLRGNRVEEFDFETAHRRQLRGNIYLAKVTRVEPSLQAAFVEYGGNRHGFLAFSEIHPDYYQIPVADRQALLEDEARAARESDEDEGGNGHRGGRRRRSRHRSHNRNDATIHSEPVNGETHAAEDHAVHETGEVSGDEHTEVEHHHADDHAEDAPYETGADTFHAASSEEPAGEAANPPVPAEIGTPVEHPQPEFAAEAQIDPPAEAPGHDAAAHHDEIEHHPHAEGGESFGAHASEANEHDGNGHDENGHDAHAGNGHGPEEHGNEEHGSDEHGSEEEEEVVESVGGQDAIEEVMERAPRYRRQYKIQEVIKRRQVMLVQVVKEERGTKGAALTTYLSLAGRYCVLMPNTARGGGISRKITSAEDRRKLREIAEELEVPEGMGVILRTAGAARTKAEVKRDFEYLLRLWEQVRDLTLKSTAPNLVYEEGSLAKRSIRDLYSKDIDEIVVAGEQGYRDAKEFMRMLMPSHAKNVKLYQDSQPVYTRYGIESQLDAMFSPTVQLRSGGYIVINQTEALVAIDVNSGRSTREHHIEDTALKTNCEAAEEVARQLRLRDLAGLIVIDFIDMDEKRNNRTVERRLKDALRNDRARIQVGRISHFGLMEMSRQRIRTSVLESSTEKCPHCGGTGHVRSVSSVALQLLRSIEETLLKGPTHNLIVRTRPEIALYVLNHKRAHLRALEERFRIAITVNSDEEVAGQVGFAVDRGEQVMSIDQAKAVLAEQAQSSGPILLEEEEPDFVEEHDEEAEADQETEGEEREHFEVSEHEPQDGEDAQPMHGDGGREGSEGPREGSGRSRRRRRRRGRGGRGSEGREGGDGYQQPHHGQGHDEGHDQFGGQQPGEFGAEQNGGYQPSSFAASDDGEPMLEGSTVQEHFGEGHAEGDAPHANGDGEHKKRRRGRRGGRRNRRGRDGQEGQDGYQGSSHEMSQGGHEGQQGGYEGQQSHGEYAPPAQGGQPDMQYESHSRPDMDERPQWSPPPETSAPHVEAHAAAAPAPQPAPEPAAPARRRSTVREAAPVSGVSAPTMTTAPEPQPAPPPAPAVASESAPAEEASKPRRTGWWAKRLLGGDKG
ncbi:Rne/Rng family ribonuclease [Rhodoplanes sp. Z2-YC6860]|uniref:Rne/Rng family ribonuclease n=1 Tax=Rhodoplanes sp. Z2-YC6860 TaxID=674703 RepID=UPI00078B9AF4|nr:ribonuclease E/G [Rhodoplanes sp. Z2-YC6860]AMN42793.1 ribonuclease, Rne/Rng family [Rhodoplanes sp. Z2-YC6860]